MSEFSSSIQLIFKKMTGLICKENKGLNPPPPLVIIELSITTI